MTGAVTAMERTIVVRTDANALVTHNTQVTPVLPGRYLPDFARLRASAPLSDITVGAAYDLNGALRSRTQAMLER